MTRALITAALAISLIGCAPWGQPRHGSQSRIGVWDRRNIPVDPDAAKVQQITAMQAKQAKCGTEVTQRQGTDGTSPRDYKCKRFS
jgi:hypothetical protein